MAEIQIAINEKKVLPEEAPFIVEYHKVRLLDKLFEEHGIEEEDIFKNMHKYKINLEPKFKRKIAQINLSVRQKVQELTKKVQNT